MRSLFAPLCLAALLLSTHSGLASDKPWKEVRSPHFRVITDGSERDARHVARAFEQMRDTFANQFPGFRLDPSSPLLILAPENEATARMLLPEFWLHDGPKPAGVFVHRWEVEFAIVRLDQILDDRRNPDTYNIVYHEYIHTLLHLNFRYLPTWLDEGLAEFYGFTRFEGPTTYIGAPSRNEHHLDILYRRPAMPLADFVEKRGSLSKDEGDTHLFYAQCWALTHFLTMGPGMENGERLKRFFNALQHGTDQKKAFQEAFGDFAKVQTDFDLYLNRFAFTAGEVGNIPQVDEKSFSSRDMTLAETKVHLASYFVARRNWKQARELAEASIAADAKFGAPHELLGFVDLNDGKDDDAMRELATAVALDDHLYRALYLKTMLSPVARSTAPADREAFNSSLSQVLKQNPAFAPAFVELAKLYVAEGDLSRALAMARTAEKYEPSRAGYHLLSGQILLRMGKPADAAASAAYVATRWRRGPDHDEAMELWNKIPESKRPALDIPPDAFPPDVHTAEGTVKSVVCEDKIMAITLEQDGKSLTFREPYYTLGFSDTFWPGSDHITPCFHNTGVRAVIRYKAASDKSYAGDGVSVGLREDLPPGAAAAPAAASPSAALHP